MFDILFSHFKRSRISHSRSRTPTHGYAHGSSYNVSTSSSQVTLTPANHNHTHARHIDLESQPRLNTDTGTHGNHDPDNTNHDDSVGNRGDGGDGEHEREDSRDGTRHDSEPDQRQELHHHQTLSSSEIEDNRQMGAFGRQLRQEEQEQWREGVVAAQEEDEEGFYGYGYGDGYGYADEYQQHEGGEQGEGEQRSESAPQIVRMPPTQHTGDWYWDWTQTTYYPHSQQPPYHVSFTHANEPSLQQQQTARTMLRLQTNNIHPPPTTSNTSSTSASTSTSSAPIQIQGGAEVQQTYATNHANHPFYTIPPPPPLPPPPSDFDFWANHHPRVKQLSPIAEVSPTPTSTIHTHTNTNTGENTGVNTPARKSSSLEEYQSLRKVGSDLLSIDGGDGVRYSGATGGSAMSGSGNGGGSGASPGTNTGIVGSRRVSQIGNGSPEGSGTGAVSFPTPVTPSGGQQPVSPVSSSQVSSQAQYVTPISAGTGTNAGVSPGGADGDGDGSTTVTPNITGGISIGLGTSTGTGTGTVTPELTRPAFINRPLNRSVSQASSIGSTSLGGVFRAGTGVAAGGNVSMSGPGSGGGAATAAGTGMGRQSPSVRSITTVSNPSPARQEAGYRLAYPMTKSRSSSSANNEQPPVVPPLDSRPSFPEPHAPGAGVELRPVLGRSGAGNKIGSGVSKSWRSSIGRALGIGMGLGADKSKTSSGLELESCGDDVDEYEDAESGYGYGYEEGVSAPGEEASGGYGYGYGYGYEEERESCSETIRYSDYLRRGYQYGHPGPGPALGGNAEDGYVDLEPPPGSRTQIQIVPPTPPPIATVPHTRSHPDSFITRRWSRDRQRGMPTDANGMRQSISNFFSLRAKKEKQMLFGLVSLTPAFWAFWLGFVCPVVWLAGGWHFTSCGEQPERMGVWEFYFACWCCGARGRRIGGDGDEDGKGKGREVPQWIAEKQNSDDGRAKLNDPKRSLRGISYGYPFVPRLPGVQLGAGRRGQGILGMIGKPNRLLDELYGVKLQEIRGRPENARRMIDPWIQRCRYAFCYACVLLALGLCAASIYLIVFNTRQLR